MSAVDLARLQFASTSIYHFLFVPLTIGLALLTAVLQTRWHRTDAPEYLRLTKPRMDLPRVPPAAQRRRPPARPACAVGRADRRRPGGGGRPGGPAGRVGTTADRDVDDPAGRPVRDVGPSVGGGLVDRRAEGRGEIRPDPAAGVPAGASTGKP